MARPRSPVPPPDLPNPVIPAERYNPGVITPLVCLALMLPLPQEPAPAPTSVLPKTGSWQAWLEIPGTTIPFQFDLARVPGGYRAFLKNGHERIPIVAYHEGSSLRLHCLPYDSWITAEIKSGGVRLDGEWVLKRGNGTESRMVFHADHGYAPRFGDSGKTARGGPRVEGRWKVQFENSTQPAVGIFVHEPHRVLGTFLTTLGDYRYLEGSWENNILQLSCFDGAHAFRFDAQMDGDGRLGGMFYSRDTYSEVWTARLDPLIELPDPFALTNLKPGSKLKDLVYTTLDGKPAPLKNLLAAPKPRIIVLFGTWCPNCTDEARLLTRLSEQYADRDLEVLGLAFEHGDDTKGQLARIKKWQEALKVPYPILLGGSSDKAKASQRFPIIDQVRAYPTTLFLKADGTVQAIHTGFTGPAAGLEHARLVESFELLVKEIL